MKKLICILLLFIVCDKVVWGQTQAEGTPLFTENVFHLSEVMLHDVASPPAASRFYAYSLLGAYETCLIGSKKTPEINNITNQKLALPNVVVPKEVDLTFCSIYAMLEVGKNIMPSGAMLKKDQDNLVNLFLAKGQSRKSLGRQINFAKTIADQVVAYARSDSYNKLSTYSRYMPKKEEGHWFPTPPEYMGAVEPKWSTVRSFFLDSASQFKPTAPAPFSKDTGSEFFRLTKEVYDVSNSLTDEQRAIANFWDCNPFAVSYSGHMAIGLKKISPGGHWIGITGIACNKKALPLESAIVVHTLVAMTLHDAFISCWQEKYTSDRLRPETAINKLIDPKWHPMLQTPPFPEYTSGHSVISSAVAVVLTSFFGDNFSFNDTSEEYFGLPSRNFNSFSEAAKEAAVSRLYGGIHYRDACDAGFEQGKRIGTYIVTKKLNAGINK